MGDKMEDEPTPVVVPFPYWLTSPRPAGRDRHRGFRVVVTVIPPPTVPMIPDRWRGDERWDEN